MQGTTGGWDAENGAVVTSQSVVQFTIIPEPSTLILAALGLALAYGCLRRNSFV